jgi:hypothetical protein
MEPRLRDAGGHVVTREWPTDDDDMRRLGYGRGPDPGPPDEPAPRMWPWLLLGLLLATLVALSP